MDEPIAVDVSRSGHEPDGRSAKSASQPAHAAANGQANGAANGSAAPHMNELTLHARQRALKDREDRELLQRIAGRDQQALERLWRKYDGELTKVLAANSPGIDDETLVTCVTDAMYEAWKNASSFAFRGSVKAWLICIALSKLKDHFRSVNGRTPDSSRSLAPQDRPRRPQFVGLDSPSALAVAAPVLDAESMVERAELVAWIRREVDALPPEFAETFRYYAFAQLSMAEIAEIHGAPIGTVKRRLFMARRRLAERAAEDGLSVPG